ncbi:MAG: GHKL domain-containing protein [Lachnospiraceae bacterium]|nr:GHKL domain-containing protein [Lachnospiraceae bacterium]
MFYEKTFTRKQFFHEKYDAVMHGIFCVFMMSISQRIFPLHSIIICFVMIITSFYYKESIHIKVIAILFLLVVQILSKFLAIGLLGNFFAQGMQKGVLTISRVQLEAILSNIFCYVFILIWSNADRCKNKELSKEERSIIFSMLVITILENCVLYRLLFQKAHLDPYRIFTTVLLFSYGMHYFMIQMLEVLNQVKIEDYDNKLKIQEKKLEKAYYYELQGKIKDLRRIRHDYRNQLLALLSVKWEDEEHLEDEIRYFLKKMEQSEKQIYSENYVLNAICKSKFIDARERDIEVQWKLYVPLKINMRCDEMGVLFGNLLDNAIEACEKVEHHRKIDFYVAVKEEKMVIRMINTKSERSSLKGEKRTTKTDEENHGFGISSVQEIVQKYEGSMEIKGDDSYYETGILLYGIHES